MAAIVGHDEPVLDATSLPTGTVTFLFSDIEGSTRLVQRFGDAYPELLERHHGIVRSAVQANGGLVVGTEGDSFFVVFPAAPEALRAAVDAQVALERHPWPESGRIRVRMGLHTGEGRIGGGSYVGVDVHRAARVAAAGHGGQVLLSASAAQLTERALPAEVSLADLGEHRLKDLLQPERIFQVTHPELQREFPPLSTLTGRPTNLPTQTSAFVGRDAELQAIGDLLADPAVRLVTLVGPGGIGKTRLALQAAAEQADRWTDGLYFVDLAPVRDADAAFDAIVRALGAVGDGSAEALATLRDHLAPRRMLLVLDNLEQVTDVAAGVAELLQACRDLKIVVTTREALRVRGERLVQVPPLGLPRPGIAPRAAVAGSEAGRLFVERARDVRPGFELTEDDASAVAEICGRLDGLPLAIELATARLALFSPHELRDRLREHVGVLGAGTRDLPARQQTLRSTIEWSERLLDDDERSIFRLFSVFDSARIDAVEAVAARLDGLDGTAMLDRLVSLVDKSLVRSLDEDGHRRLAMLRTIRDYAAERLDEEPELLDVVRRAHAEYYADMAHERRARLSGPDRASALAELEADLGNLREAWRTWVEAGDLGRLDAMLDALWALHDDRGWYHGAVELANDLLDVLSTSPPTVDRALEEITLRTSLARGLMAIRGYTPEVEETYASALAQLDETGAPVEALPLLRSLASFHLYRGEFDKGIAVGRQLLDLAEQPAGRNAPGRGAPADRHEPRVARTGGRGARAPRPGDRALRSRSARLGPAAAGSEPRHRALHDVGVRAVVDRAPRSGGRAWCPRAADRRGAGPSLQRRVRALPRRVPRHVAPGLAARPRAGLGGAADRRGARLPGMEGAGSDLPRGGGGRGRTARRGHGAQRSGLRALPGSHDAAGVLAAAALRSGERARHGGPAGGGA